MIRQITASILLCLSFNVLASDHLEPEDSTFSSDFSNEYHNQVVTYFRSGFDDKVILRSIVLPSFEPEYMVGIKKVDAGYSVFYDRPEVQLWAYDYVFNLKQKELEEIKSEYPAEYEEKLNKLKQQYPKNILDAKHVSCEKPIDKNLAKDIHFIWIEMLLKTKYSRESHLGRDGVTYHFSGINYLFEQEQDDLKVLMRFNGVYAGKVWSPEPKFKTGKLVEISDLMVDYCLKDDGGKLEKLLVKKVGRFKKFL